MHTLTVERITHFASRINFQIKSNQSYQLYIVFSDKSAKENTNYPIQFGTSDDTIHVDRFQFRVTYNNLCKFCRVQTFMNDRVAALPQV